jgi:hypothetical protein
VLEAPKLSLSVTIPPTMGAPSEAVPVTNVGGGVTVSVSAALVMPLAAAVIWVVPMATPAAKPLLLMVALPVALLAQVNTTPLMVLPLPSFAVAVNC